MKILLYSFDYHPCFGGVDTFVNQLNRGLRKLGHEVNFICSSHIRFLRKAILHDIENYQREMNYRLKDFPASIRRIEALTYANECMIKNINLSSYDLVHSNNGLSSYVMSKVAPHKPLFGTVHGSYVLESELSGIVESTEYVNVMRTYDEHAVECPTIVHTVSEAMTRVLPPIAEGKHIVIPNGVDVNDFQPVFKSHDLVRIACAGNLSYQKGYDTLIEALALLKREGKDSFVVDIYGDGPLRNLLEEQVAHDHVSVTFRGIVDRDRLKSILSSYDIFVHPSRYETFGLAVTEALASGCAVICTNVGGLIEQVTDGYNGLLFEVGAARQLASCIWSLVTNSKYRGNLANSAVETVSERFSIDKLIVQFERAYVETIERHSEIWGQ